MRRKTCKHISEKPQGKMGETESILLRTFSKVGKNVFCEKETFYK
jgi:hypothetical protein